MLNKNNNNLILKNEIRDESLHYLLVIKVIYTVWIALSGFSIVSTVVLPIFYKKFVNKTINSKPFKIF